MDCQQRGINMTSVADGSQLGFLSTRELCTLVGAPLDNAIESVLAEPDPEKRLLRVAIYNQSGCVMLRFENYCAQRVEMGADGLPVHNAHGGYDLQGVQAAAQRHDGTMTLHWPTAGSPCGSCCRSHREKRLCRRTAMTGDRFVILHNKTALEIVD